MDFTCAVCAGCGQHGSKAHPLFRCGACLKTMYCCQDCQKSNWKEHKPMCDGKREVQMQEHTDMAFVGYVRVSDGQADLALAKLLCTPVPEGDEDPVVEYGKRVQGLFGARREGTVNYMLYLGTNWAGYDKNYQPSTHFDAGIDIRVKCFAWPITEDKNILIYYAADDKVPLHPDAAREPMHHTMAQILGLLAEIAGLDQTPAMCVIIGAEFITTRDEKTGQEVHTTAWCTRQLKLPIYGSRASANPDTAPSYLLPRYVDLAHVLSFFHHVLHTKCPCGKWRRNENGRFLFCNRCKDTVYCSRECQKKDWQCHRLVCIRHKSA